MASQRHSEDDALVPPQPMFILEGPSDHDNRASIRTTTTHSRTTSNAASAYQESPPQTPRSTTTFIPNRQSNPFSPPASVINFSIPERPPLPNHGHYPSFDSTRSPLGSRATSMTDLPRASSSWYGGPGVGGDVISRPGTPGYAASSRGSSARMREAFRSPPARTLTVYKDVNLSTKVSRERQKSTLLSVTAPDGVPKPWLETRDPFSRIAYWVTYGAMFLGLAAGALRCYTGYFDVPMMTGNLCPVLDEDFTGSADSIFGENGTFFREVDMSGFGNGEFEMTTDSSNNSYIQDGQLWIVPTFTSDQIGDAAIIDGYTYNITDCTYNITHGFSYTPQAKNVPVNVSAVGSTADFDAAAYNRACTATSNHSIAQVINPIQTARLNTRRTASIKYGRVDVRAKLPTGDWLWPAIWMLPVDNNYGPWPMSGEIDIMEARGNGPLYPYQGINFVRGSLNWGPLTWLNAVSKTFGFREEKRGRFDHEYHIYSLEWDEEFMRIFVDSRLHVTLSLQVKKSFWDIGDFPAVVQNGSQAVILDNPWVNGTKMAPFDQPFYLILSLGVGGTNGWFPDDNDKPWLNGAQNAMAEFWRRQSEWYGSWGTTTEERAFIIDYVKMWQKC